MVYSFFGGFKLRQLLPEGLKYSIGQINASFWDGCEVDTEHARKNRGLANHDKRVHCSVEVQYNGFRDNGRSKKGLKLNIGFTRYQGAIFEVKHNGNIGTWNKLLCQKRFIEENLELTDKPFVLFVISKKFDVKHCIGVGLFRNDVQNFVMVLLVTTKLIKNF